MYNEDGYCYEPTEFELKINELIQNEVDTRVSEVNTELFTIKEQLKATKEKLCEAEKRNKELQKIVDQNTLFINFKNLINKDNFKQFVGLLNLKSNTFKFDGMDIEQVPLWFELVFRYYEDKERLFQLMDLFEIDYPEWAKEYIMPYEYSKEELKLFIDPSYNRYITNGCLFEHNIGFFWRNIQACKGNTYKILTNRQSFTNYIPWQLVLSNKLWAEDDMFELIVDAVKNNKRESQNYFRIQQYNILNEKQIDKLAKCLPTNGLSDVHKYFIEHNTDIIKKNNRLAQAYRKEINDNHYSVFYYLNFPVNMQIDFVKQYTGGFETKTSLIQKMDIPKEEKIKLLLEVES